MKPEQPTSVSWWLDQKPEGFTAYVEKEHQARMSASTLGKGRGRVVPPTTEELQR